MDLDKVVVFCGDLMGFCVGMLRIIVVGVMFSASFLQSESAFVYRNLVE